MQTRYLARAVANWLTLSTPGGLLIAGLGRAVVTRKPDGLYLAEHCRIMLPDAGAFTVGNVIITGGKLADLSGTDVLAHEAAHSSQWALLGPAFLPVYLAMTAWSLSRTGDRAARNYLERWAGLTRGGYEET